MFVDKTSESMSLEIFGKRKMYKLLQKIEFTSDRKKMTVVI
jgi:magnesium-transporting ATPase (P-type)